MSRMEPYQPPGIQPTRVVRHDPVAARAGMLMFAIAGILAVFGAMSLGALFMPAEAKQQVEQMYKSVRSEAPATLELEIIVGVSMLGTAALAMAVLGFFVRRSSRIAAILSIVATGLLVIYLGINLLGSLVMMGANAAAGGAAVIMMLLPLTLAAMVMSLLIRMLRTSQTPPELRIAPAPMANRGEHDYPTVSPPAIPEKSADRETASGE